MIFIASGVIGHQQRSAIDYAQSKGAPNPETLVPLSGWLIAGAGVMIIVGFWADLAALGIGAFLVAMNLTMHRFWEISDPQAQQMEMTQFMKNLSMLGGALIIFWLYKEAEGDFPPISLNSGLF